MRVIVDLGSPSPGTSLVEPEDFKTFKLVCKGGGDTRSLQSALGGLGFVDEDKPHVWLSIESLNALTGALASDPDLTRRLDEMVGYAERMVGCRQTVRSSGLTLSVRRAKSKRVDHR